MDKLLDKFELNKIHKIDNVVGIDKLPDKSIDVVFTDGPCHATSSLPWLYRLHRVMKDTGIIYQPTPTTQRVGRYKETEYTDYSAQSWLDVYLFFGFCQLDKIVSRNRGAEDPLSHYLWVLFVKKGFYTLLRDNRAVFLNYPIDGGLSKEIKGMGRSVEEYSALIEQTLVQKNMVILDIHAGSGSCGVAALELASTYPGGLDYLGFENDTYGEGICDQANERLDKVKGKLKKRKKK